MLSEVIMKALCKAPEDRYQSGQDLVNDLERCKESTNKAEAKKSAQPAKGLNVPAAPKPAPAPAARVENVEPPPPARVTAQSAPKPASQAKAAAAAAGWESSGSSFTVDSPRTPKASPPAAQALTSYQEQASAVAEPAEASEAPALHVDPAMQEGGKGGPSGPSFSEISELPPLKETYTPPPPPAPPAAPETEAPAASFISRTQPEKPKVQPREVARKAVTEIKKTPPKLFVYSIAAALAVILLVVGMIAYHIHSENSADDSSTEQQPAAAQNSGGSAQPAWNAAQPPAVAPSQAQPEQVAAAPERAPRLRNPEVQPEKNQGASGLCASRDPGTTRRRFHA